MMYGVGLGMIGLGGLMMVGFWLLVFVGIVGFVAILARGTRSTAVPAAANQMPADALNLRYASGEITKEQWDQARKSPDA